MQAAPQQEAAALLQQGIEALRSGDKQRARQYLAQTLRLDPQNDQAWLWLSGVVADDEQRRQCLERALAINPQNEAARQGLAHLAAQAQPAEQPAAENATDPPPQDEQPGDTVAAVPARSATVETAGVPAAIAIEQLRSTKRTRSPVLPIVIGVCILVLVVLVAVLILRMIR